MTQRLERGARIQHVRLALGVRLHRFVSLKRFGAMVAEEEGRDAYDTSTAKRWEDGSAIGVAAVEAMARLAQANGIPYVTRAWIAFGDEGIEEVRSAPAVPDIELPAKPVEDSEAEPSKILQTFDRKSKAKAAAPRKNASGTRKGR